MRNVIFVLFFFSLPSTLWASDPIIGTWIFSSDQTTAYLKSLNMPLPDPSIFTFSSRTEVYKELEAGLIEFTLTITRTDGSTEVEKRTWPAQGGIVEDVSSEGILLVETLIAPGEWYVTRLQDGKQIQFMQKVVSEDGKIMRQTIEGVGEWGPYNGVMVFEKQTK